MCVYLFQRMQEQRLDRLHPTLEPVLAERTSRWKGPPDPQSAEGNTGLLRQTNSAGDEGGAVGQPPGTGLPTFLSLTEPPLSSWSHLPWETGLHTFGNGIFLTQIAHIFFLQYIPIITKADRGYFTPRFCFYCIKHLSSLLMSARF